MSTPFPPPRPVPPPPPSPHAPMGWSAPVPASSGMATAALVCGIAGLVLCAFVVPSIVALVLGLIAASRAKQSGDPRAGLGRARAGWIMGAAGVAIFVGLIVVAIATGEGGSNEGF